VIEGKKILVTGGSGLFGGWIVEKLLDLNAYVFSLSHENPNKSKLSQIKNTKNLTILLEDTRNEESIEKIVSKEKFDFIIHLASQTQVVDAINDPINTFTSNLNGAWNILDSIRRNELDTKVIVSTSDKAYGIPESIPTNENHKLHGVFPYEFSKSAEDLLAQTYSITYGLDIAILRCGNVFGGGDLNFNRLIPKVIKAFIENKTPTISRSGGDYSRDFIYVEDVVGAFVKTLEHFEVNNELKIFNISNPPNISILEIYKNISNVIMGKYIEPNILGKQGAPYEIPHQSLDINKAKINLGWEPKWSHEEGLLKTYKWYVEYFNN